MNERIKAIRKQAKQNQAEFGSHLGISLSAVSAIESGKNNPSEQTIRAICSEFRVNRTWLETGEGEPYQESALIPELLRVVQKYPNLQAALERVLPLMDDDDWQALDRFLDKIEKKEL